MNQESNKQITIIQNMVVGETTFLHIAAQSDEVAESRIAWSSDDPEVATVNPHSGLVTAQQAGETLLYATDMDSSEIMETYTLTVEAPVLTRKIIVDPKRLQLEVGDTTTVDATVDPDDASQDIQWCSSDSHVVRVGRFNGKVRAVKVGHAQIIAKAQDGSGVRGYCTVDVTGTQVIVKCTNGLDVMSEAIGGVVLGKFADGTTVSLVNETPQNETMFYVYGRMSNGTWAYGWSSGEYLASQTEYAYLRMTDNYKVRSGPSLNYSILGTLESGGLVKIMEKEIESDDENDKYVWHKVIFEDNEGYVAAYEIGCENTPYYIILQHWEALINGQPPYVPSKASEECLAFIRDYETFSGTVYDDDYGNPTIGYGHKIGAGETFDTITEEEALQLFANDVLEFEKMVTNYSKNRCVIWNQHEFDAFVSLCFNSGGDTGDVMDDILAKTDPYDAFTKVIISNGIVSSGLYCRRMDEADIFVRGEYIREERDLPQD